MTFGFECPFYDEIQHRSRINWSMIVSRDVSVADRATESCGTTARDFHQVPCPSVKTHAPIRPADNHQSSAGGGPSRIPPCGSAPGAEYHAVTYTGKALNDSCWAVVLASAASPAFRSREGLSPKHISCSPVVRAAEYITVDEYSAYKWIPEIL